MSRTGNCTNNAPMGSVAHTLTVEIIHQHRRTTRDNAQRDPFATVEGTTTRARIHSAHWHVTPEQAKLMAR